MKAQILPKHTTETIATFDTANGKIEVTFSDRLGLHVRHDGRLIVANASTEYAQNIVNDLSMAYVWTA